MIFAFKGIPLMIQSSRCFCSLGIQKNEDPNKEPPSLTKLFERTRERKEGHVYADTYDETERLIVRYDIKFIYYIQLVRCELGNHFSCL